MISPINMDYKDNKTTNKIQQIKSDIPHKQHADNNV